MTASASPADVTVGSRWRNNQPRYRTKAYRPAADLEVVRLGFYPGQPGECRVALRRLTNGTETSMHVQYLLEHYHPLPLEPSGE